MLYEQDMKEEAYHDGSSMDLWIGSDWIWHLELQMRSVNVWDMTRGPCVVMFNEGFSGKV
jgi:hypothetical protein